MSMYNTLSQTVKYTWGKRAAKMLLSHSCRFIRSAKFGQYFGQAICFKNISPPQKTITQRIYHIAPLSTTFSCNHSSGKKGNQFHSETPLLRQSKYHEMEKDLKYRENPVITVLDNENFHSIFNDNLKSIHSIFEKYNYELRIAGGAVRDLMMGIKPADVDFATNATPQQMIDMFTTEGIRMINTRGELHGTVTARINDEENFEVTTLRIDLTTDGRHANVEFTDSWILDANRRDLTINSMFLGFDGKVYDYFYGYEDLQQRRVVFVGEAANRIQEDYLRILRYFRFYGRIAEGPNNFDEKTIEAIRANIDGLQKISGERIWTELKKILQGNFRIDILAKMIECGAKRNIGLPDEIDTTDLFRLKQCLKKSFNGIPINAITILATILNSRDDAFAIHSRLRLSAYERDLALFLTEHKEATRDINDLLYYQKMCLPRVNRSFKLNKEYVLELLKLNDKKRIFDDLLAWEMPRFEINGTILMEKGCPSGKKMKFVIQKLRDLWADSNFTLQPNKLLEQLPTILTELAENDRAESSRKKPKLNK